MIEAPYPEFEELLTAIGEAGQRLSEIEACEGAAGNISVYIGWPIEPRRWFPLVETIPLPQPVPELADRIFLGNRRAEHVARAFIGNARAKRYAASAGESWRFYKSTVYNGRIERDAFWPGLGLLLRGRRRSEWPSSHEQY